MESPILWRRIQRYVKTGHESSKVDLKYTLELSGSGKAELVKDITAIANTPGGDGYIIIGVKDIKDRSSKDPKDYVGGFAAQKGSDQFECTVYNILSDFCNRIPKIKYDEIICTESGKTIGVITIYRSTDKPHTIIKASSDIEPHQTWIRRGTASFIATPDELYAMKDENSLDVPASILINLSTHPLTDEQHEEIKKHIYVEEEIEIPVHCEPANVITHIQNLIDEIGLTMDEWSTRLVVLALPGLSPLAATILAYIHGVKGGFPKILWITLHPDGGRYILGDLIDLQKVRDSAREKRAMRIKNESMAK